ncbi:RBBP9/YdeN family alpha/beta hydrolase [Gordonia sp. MP11Mi]|uniref:Hydrolase YdeN n=1 Tax=Gordonia sp. MP11Mi TaxID=3022769 RepID=A0AA97CUL7_9ACTN
MSINRTLIVHGFGAGIDDHWFRWLANETHGDRLALPDARRPDADTWTSLVADALANSDEGTAVVAHSLGCVTVARALQQVSDVRLGAFVAVAPFRRPLSGPFGDTELDCFIADGLDAFLAGTEVAAVRRRITRATVFASDDDPIVPSEASDEFAADLDVAVRVVPGAGHFLADDGVSTLPQILDGLDLRGL